MSDANVLLNDIVAWTRRYAEDLEHMRTISDRIGADSAMATNLAAAATKAGRTDLVAADFDNYKICVDLDRTLLNSSNGSTVSVSINTGGTVKLGFYKIL